MRLNLGRLNQNKTVGAFEFGDQYIEDTYRGPGGGAAGTRTPYPLLANNVPRIQQCLPTSVGVL